MFGLFSLHVAMCSRLLSIIWQDVNWPNSSFDVRRNLPVLNTDSVVNEVNKSQGSAREHRGLKILVWLGGDIGLRSVHIV